jgi:hypothetical protein
VVDKFDDTQPNVETSSSKKIWPMRARAVLGSLTDRCGAVGKGKIARGQKVRTRLL